MAETQNGGFVVAETQNGGFVVAESETKVCPLTMQGGQFAICLRERCAWWVRDKNETFSGCAARALVDKVSNLSYFMRKLADHDQ